MRTHIQEKTSTHAHVHNTKHACRLRMRIHPTISGSMFCFPRSHAISLHANSPRTNGCMCHLAKASSSKHRWTMWKVSASSMDMRVQDFFSPENSGFVGTMLADDVVPGLAQAAAHCEVWHRMPSIQRKNKEDLGHCQWHEKQRAGYSFCLSLVEAHSAHHTSCRNGRCRLVCFAARQTCSKVGHRKDSALMVPPLAWRRESSSSAASHHAETQ